MSKGNWYALLVAVLFLVGLYFYRENNSAHIGVPLDGVGTLVTPARTDDRIVHLEVTPQNLEGAYLANEVAADRSFTGRWLVVRGRVDSIDRAPDGRPRVRLDSGPLTSLHCMLGVDQEVEASKLSRGQSVAVSGKCVGRVVGGVKLDPCRLLTAEDEAKILVEKK